MTRRIIFFSPDIQVYTQVRDLLHSRPVSQDYPEYIMDINFNNFTFFTIYYNIYHNLYQEGTLCAVMLYANEGVNTNEGEPEKFSQHQI